MKTLALTLTCLALAALAGLSALWAAPAGGGTLNVAVPAGDFTLWLSYKDTAGAQQASPVVKAAGTKVALDLAPLGAKFSEPTLVVLDGATGNAAVKPAALKPGATAEMAVTAADFTTLFQLRVRVLDASRQPAASATVTVTDPKGKARTQPLLPNHDGTVDFDLLPFGKANVSVAFPDGTKRSEDVQVKADHAPGAMTLEMAPANAVAAPANSPAAPAGAAANAPAPTAAVPAPPGTAAAPAAPPAAPAPATPAPTPAPSGGNPLGSLIGVIFLAGVGYVAYRAAHERGVTVDGVLKRLGVTVPPPDAAASAGTTAAKPLAPAQPLVPEGHCPFCGQAKDASGACACSVASAPLAAWGAAPDPVAPTGTSPLGGGGPRLVAVQGPAMGASFALVDGPAAIIGRAVENAIALPQDTAVSRRHASISRGDGGWVLRDEGSSNGTFVNGMRVTERLLQPGDEIQVGNSRLRLEL